jgi:hypothetical protein
MRKLSRFLIPSKSRHRRQGVALCAAIFGSERSLHAVGVSNSLRHNLVFDVHFDRGLTGSSKHLEKFGGFT